MGAIGSSAGANFRSAPAYFKPWLELFDGLEILIVTCWNLLWIFLLSYIFFFYRETLLGQLQVYMKSIKDDFNLRTSESKPPTGKNLPEVVNNIVWVRQLEAKVI